ncbi:sensor histidine kinase [Paractinoplanes brasiliensis]|uniref:histidine kinase n=1 Tax=Paractinoplanes brasiliensis TaxID=52695 RepID=A0A4R6JUX8_9ACTN|nr:HAMP domain-containing sensor histidine kinase [Actinoplanes brasiliensis]TDO38926.1 two-component system sensor histidine kinase BaeS [Actinoplanes brasiliensis]GID26296.1 two-component sensor histidine kinase [Actinoplanes brasiliensis]
MNGGRVPLRHSLVTRLLATSVLIAIAGIASTAWLAVRTATRAISQEQGRALADDKGVYDMLVAYAATHADWTGAPALIQERAQKLGRRITLMTEDRAVIVDSVPGPSLQTARPSAVVDPLNLDLSLTGGSSRIDRRVVGPFRVATARERQALRKAAEDDLTCWRRRGTDGTISQAPNGRPVLTLRTPEVLDSGCSSLDSVITPSEDKALRSLGQAISRCVRLDERLYQLLVRPDFTTYVMKAQLPRPVEPTAGLLAPAKGFLPEKQAARVDGCVEKSRRAVLQPYVAPPALLFVTDPRSDPDPFTLSTANSVRIVAVTGAVLLATIFVTVLVGRRLVRPLRALTDSADRHVPATVSTKDEIGRLARALNESTERRDRAEAQRRAMVSDVAHELRTPLTNIRSWLEAAQDDLAPTDAQLLTLLHEEAVLLQHIIDDLSDLSAADAGTLRIHPEPIYLRDVLTQVVDSHRGAANGVHLTIEADGDPVVTADPVRLRQLVGNLVSNAVRHTPAGGTVTVGASAAAITVRDTGVGIAPENLPRIFDRFWRADESRSRATGGSGLGLAIARKLADAHHFTIGVDSTVGVGTTFTIRLDGG